MRLRNATIAGLVLAAILLASGALGEDRMSVVNVGSSDNPAALDVQAAPAGAADTYTGQLRVYMVEPASRYRDGSSHTYEFGFLEFAAITTLNISDGAVWDTTFIWDDSNYPVTQYNIMATAVVFNPNGVTKDADPNNGNWFSAHYGDAAAGAKAGKRGRNYIGADFTHTVFVEEGTATW